MILLAAPGGSSPQLADFQAVNARYAPRQLDMLMFFQNFGVEPVWYGAYLQWAAQLGASVYVTLCPSVPLSTFTSGAQDAYLKAQALTVAAYGKPVILRLGHEFNGSWGGYGNGHETPAQFKAAWRHIVNVFRLNGADNALWCWCPNVWGNDSHTVDPSGWYSGDDYVDLIGLDGYMTTRSTTVAQPADLFLQNYRDLMSLTTRPFIIGEVGCAADHRLDATGGRAAWFDRFFDMVTEQMPACIAVGMWERVDPTEGDFTTDSSGTDPTARTGIVSRLTAGPLAPPLLALVNR